MATDPTDAGQVLYGTILDSMRYGIEGHGVLSGCAITAQGTPDNTVAVAAGYCVDGAGALVTVTGGNATITARHLTLDRKDLIYIDTTDDTQKTIAGTASANPNPPDLSDANDIILAVVTVTAGDPATTAATDIADSDIQDCRQMLYGNQAVRTASDWHHYNSGDIKLYSNYATQTAHIDGGTGGFGKDASVLTFATGASGLATFAGDIKITGNSIKDSTGNDVLTFDSGGTTTVQVDAATARLDITSASTNTSTLVFENATTGLLMTIDAANTASYIYSNVGNLVLRGNTGSDVECNDHFYPTDDSTFTLGADGKKWSTAYFDASDSTDPSSWNDKNCLSMLINPEMWKNRPKDSPYYISKVTNTIQLDPSTCPFEMQDVYMHRTRYQKWIEEGSKNKPPNRNPDDPNYDPQEIGLLINDLVTFNSKCLRELYPKYLELKKEVEKLKEKMN